MAKQTLVLPIVAVSKLIAGFIDLLTFLSKRLLRGSRVRCPVHLNIRKISANPLRLLIWGQVLLLSISMLFSYSEASQNGKDIFRSDLAEMLFFRPDMDTSGWTSGPFEAFEISEKKNDSAHIMLFDDDSIVIDTIEVWPPLTGIQIHFNYARFSDAGKLDTGLYIESGNLIGKPSIIVDSITHTLTAQVTDSVACFCNFNAEHPRQTYEQFRTWVIFRFRRFHTYPDNFPQRYRIGVDTLLLQGTSDALPVKGPLHPVHPSPHGALKKYHTMFTISGKKLNTGTPSIGPGVYLFNQKNEQAKRAVILK